ncbi:MAG: hypothetical protein FWB86_01185 [Treponema sp.]|nr:hypothetical protein [Treponema sp.]MCL2250712.1 hypothetical protein [Treponema sp.]
MFSYQYFAVRHDYIDNGAGDLMVLVEPPAGEAQDDDVRFIFDGIADAMLIRNNDQIIYLPCLNEAVIKIIRNCKDILVAEMQDYDLQIISDSIKKKTMPDFSDYYTAQVIITNNPLEIPKEKLYELRAIYGLG